MSELKPPERRKRKAPRSAFKPGQSGNPGGQSKEKRAFLERLRIDDVEDIYEALMSLVREGNAPAVLRAVEYVAGKPPDVVEVSGRDGGPVRVLKVDPKSLTAEELALLRRMMLAKQEG